LNRLGLLFGEHGLNNKTASFLSAQRIHQPVSSEKLKDLALSGTYILLSQNAMFYKPIINISNFKSKKLCKGIIFWTDKTADKHTM
jgi:hypothetical protein